VHCHIAWQASSGLSLQILERGSSINVSSDIMEEAGRVCGNWDKWFAEVGNHSG
jgi:hypothetical protein